MWYANYSRPNNGNHIYEISPCHWGKIYMRIKFNVYLYLDVPIVTTPTLKYKANGNHIYEEKK
jgi:hypothetical protein